MMIKRLPSALIKLLAGPVFLIYLGGCGVRAGNTTGGNQGGTSDSAVVAGNPNGSGSGGQLFSGAVVKGPVAGAEVEFYSMNESGDPVEFLGSTVTDDVGNFSIMLDDVPDDPLLIQAYGGSYTDEATRIPTDIPYTQPLAVILNAGERPASVSLTPVTTIAAKVAVQTVAETGLYLETATTIAKADVSQSLGLADVDINKVLPQDLAESAEATSPSEETIRYSLVLSAMSQYVAEQGNDPEDALKLVDDLTIAHLKTTEEVAQIIEAAPTVEKAEELKEVIKPRPIAKEHIFTKTLDKTAENYVQNYSDYLPPTVSTEAEEVKKEREEKLQRELESPSTGESEPIVLSKDALTIIAENNKAREERKKAKQAASSSDGTTSTDSTTDGTTTTSGDTTSTPASTDTPTVINDETIVTINTDSAANYSAATTNSEGETSNEGKPAEASSVGVSAIAKEVAESDNKEIVNTVINRPILSAGAIKKIKDPSSKKETKVKISKKAKIATTPENKESKTQVEKNTVVAPDAPQSSTQPTE